MKRITKLSLKLIVTAQCALGLLVSFTAIAQTHCGSVIQPQSQNATSATYLPGAFKQIAIEGTSDVQLSQGSIDQVIVEGDQNARNQIEVTVADGKLSVRNLKNWKFWNASKLKLRITVRELNEASLLGAGDLRVIGPLKSDKLHLRITGAGDVMIDELVAEELRVSIAGAGDVKVAGVTRSLWVSIAGSGDFMGEKLRAIQAKLSIAGAGDIRAWVSEDLSASIAGAGSIEFWGNTAKVNQSVSGVGSVTSRGEKAK